jgi:hypothetical protein
MDRSANRWIEYGPAQIVMSDDGKHVVLVLSDDSRDTIHPRLLVVSERSSGWEDSYIDVPFGLNGQAGRYHGQVASVAFSPDNNQIHVVSATGEAISIATADHLVTHREVRGAFAANWDTYLPPLPSSPVEWTSNGNVMFSVATDGALELVRGETLLKRIVAPEGSGAEQHGWNPELGNPVTAIAVSPAGDKFVVAFARGMGMWGCANSLPAGETAMRGVTVRAARSADSPFVIELSVTLDGEPTLVHGFTIYENDMLFRANLAWDSPLAYHTPSTEPVTVIVEARDAFGMVRSQPVRVGAAD